MRPRDRDGPFRVFVSVVAVVPVVALHREVSRPSLYPIHLDDRLVKALRLSEDRANSDVADLRNTREDAGADRQVLQSAGEPLVSPAETKPYLVASVHSRPS